MTKKLLSLLLVAVLLISAAAPTFASTAAPTATQKKVIDAIWQYTNEPHAMLTGVLEKYFLISDPASKAQFLVVYQDVLTALGGYGSKIESFGLTAEILEKLNTKMTSGKPNTYQAFINKDYAAFEAGILGSWTTLVTDYTEAKLVSLADGLNKVFPVAKQYVALKNDPELSQSLKMLGYTAGNNSITSTIDHNISVTAGKVNLALGTSVDSADVKPALTKMVTFYNGLNSADKALVYSVLQEQGFLYRRLAVNPISNVQTTLTGTAEPNANIRATVNGNPLTSGFVLANGTTGAFSLTGFTAQLANSVITVEIFKPYGPGTVVLDSATVTVSNALPPVDPNPPVNPPGPVTPPTPITPPGPVVPPTEPDVEIDEPETPLGAVTFDDLLTYSWAQEAIAALAKSGVVKGRTDKLFMPKENVTRAEFAAMVVRLLKLSVDKSQNQFADVKPTDWFVGEVRTAFVNQLMKGVTSQRFNPQGFITRQEMSTIIGRVLVINKFLVKDQSILKQFADLKDIATWALSDTKLTVQEGIIQGRATTKNNQTVNVFAPKANANRAETAVMLYRLAGKIPTAVTVASK